MKYGNDIDLTKKNKFDENTITLYKKYKEGKLNSNTIVKDTNYVDAKFTGNIIQKEKYI